MAGSIDLSIFSEATDNEFEKLFPLCDVRQKTDFLSLNELYYFLQFQELVRLSCQFLVMPLMMNMKHQLRVRLNKKLFYPKPPSLTDLISKMYLAPQRPNNNLLKIITDSTLKNIYIPINKFK